LAKQLTTFVVSQFDRNAIANATNELKGVLVRAGDFVHVMSQRGNYVDRVVVSSPVHRHTLVVVLVSEHALDRLLVDVTRTHFLEPVEAIYSFKPQSLGSGQSDRDSIVADEFERGLVIVMESFVGEGFVRTAHGDVVAVLVPADIYFVTRHAIEVRERAFNGLAVDICPVHESYFQFESKKLLAGFFIPCCSSRNSKNRASNIPRAIPTIATTNRIAAKCSCVIAMLGKRPKSLIVH